MRAVSATVLASLSLQPRLSAVQPANSKNSATGNSSRRGGRASGSTPTSTPSPSSHQIASPCSWRTTMS